MRRSGGLGGCEILNCINKNNLLNILTRIILWNILYFWAGIAQLVEYKLPKLGVASSNLVARSKDVRLFVCLGVWVEFLFMYMWFVASSF